MQKEEANLARLRTCRKHRDIVLKENLVSTFKEVELFESFLVNNFPTMKFETLKERLNQEDLLEKN
jgi:hypothetical protein